MKVVIADDEPLARKRLQLLLAPREEVTIVASSRSGQEALEAILQHHPDLVFLDVQMPDLDGFGVLKALPVNYHPEIIFVTAYNQYAMQAFDFAALDYLLKPFDDDRFELALTRAVERISQKQVRPEEGIQRLLDHLRLTPPPGRRRLAIVEGSRVRFADPAQISHITGEGAYARLHLPDKTMLIRQTLKSLEVELAFLFLRIHRSTLINREFVQELHARPHGEYDLLLTDGSVVRVSRSYREVLVAELGLKK